MAVRNTGPGPWSTPADIIGAVRRRWERGDFLTALATDAPWEPVALPIRGPSAGEIAADFAAVRDRTDRWRSGQARLLRLEYRTVGGRHFGTNQIPCRAWIDDATRLWSLINATHQARRFTDLVRYTRQHGPRPGRVDGHPTPQGPRQRTDLARTDHDRAVDRRQRQPAHLPAADRRAGSRHQVRRGAPDNPGQPPGPPAARRARRPRPAALGLRRTVPVPPETQLRTATRLDPAGHVHG